MNGRVWKKKIVDDYLRDSGASRFEPSEFVAWLSEHPEHEAYGLFFQEGEDRPVAVAPC